MKPLPEGRREKTTNFSPAEPSLTKPDDNDLVRECLRGSSGACETLLGRYERVLFNVALRIVRHREDARDVAQTALVKAFEHLERFDPSHRFAGWIAQIGIHEALDFLDRRRRLEPIDDGFPSDASGPEQGAETRELRQVLEEALMRLSMDNRMVVILRHFMELSYQEMAAILDLPEKTVKSRLFSARQQLREVLAGRGVRPC
jgi:RNA polymerase sigma-70 factor (ECF subfamily)